MKGKGTVGGGWWAGARGAAVAAGVAVIVAGVGSRVNRVGFDFSVDPPVEGVLLRRVEAVEVDMLSLADAADSLSGAFGVRVDVDRGRFPPAGPAGAGVRDVMKLRGVTLAEALARVLPRFATHSVEPSYFVEGGTVHVGRSEDVEVREPNLVRAYGIADLLAEPPELARASAGGRTWVCFPADPSQKVNARQEREDAVGRLVMETVMPTVWKDAGGARGAVRVFDDTMVVSGPASVQRKVQRLLFLVRHPAGPGDGKEAGR